MSPARCDELRERLDSVGPAGLTTVQLAHARECETCTAELQAALAIEAMLRAAPPTTSAAFTANVMSRVEATERARRRLAEMPSASIWQRWLRAVLDEPIAVVALALAPVPILMALLWPGLAMDLTAFLHDAVATWIAAASSATAMAGTGVSEISSPMHAVANLLGIPVLVALALLGFQWLGVFGGSLTSDRRAQSESTSRRKPS